MNLLLKILFILIGLFSFQCVNTDMLPASTGTHINYIQNDCQKVVLISQNFAQNIVVQSSNNDYQTGISDSHSIPYINTNNVFLKSATPRNAQDYFHNLSTNIKNEISIRAP